MSLDSIEGFSVIGHPLIHGLLAPLSHFAVHLQFRSSSSPQVEITAMRQRNPYEPADDGTENHVTELITRFVRRMYHRTKH